jgi:hypothetical protein
MTTGRPRALCSYNNLELTRKLRTRPLDYINMEPNYSWKASRMGGRGLDRYLAGEKANHTEFHYKQYDVTSLHPSRYSPLQIETVIPKPTIIRAILACPSPSRQIQVVHSEASHPTPPCHP